jgi:hypothetical protein
MPEDPGLVGRHGSAAGGTGRPSRPARELDAREGVDHDFEIGGHDAW